MKIGILTFHWATNYGAVLQTFALQKYLSQLGHNVTIINYKPSRQDNSIWLFVRRRYFLHPIQFLNTLLKERKIDKFRKENLNLSIRYKTKHDVDKYLENLNVVICGSDQIWNPSFLRSGERGVTTTTYFLDFNAKIKKISYAASFGCTTYPAKYKQLLQTLFGRFNHISVREQTGKNIIEEMGLSSVVVPDPTILLTAQDYNSYIPNGEIEHSTPYSFIYMLRGEKCSKHIDYLKSNNRIVESTNEGIEQWVTNIKKANYVVTNSFHCMVFCLQYHIPFSVVLKNTGLVGMNDRFYTILEMCQLSDRITSDNGDVAAIINKAINWADVEKALSEYRKIGIDFLQNSIEL